MTKKRGTFNAARKCIFYFRPLFTVNKVVSFSFKTFNLCIREKVYDCSNAFEEIIEQCRCVILNEILLCLPPDGEVSLGVVGRIVSNDLHYQKVCVRWNFFVRFHREDRMEAVKKSWQYLKGENSFACITYHK